jgi:D-alanyl-D-alanine carboxypeptidase
LAPRHASSAWPVLTALPIRWATAFLVAVCLLLQPLVLSAQEVPELQITSKRYIVIDAETGEVFAQRDASDEVAIASLTKVFTTIEALERGSLDQEITTKESDLQSSDATVMGFGPGETFTLQDLLYGMMLPSGNDAAHAIARALGTEDGSSDQEDVDRYVGWMNDRISSMGLTQTTLVRPDGWGVAGHHSSAHDLAVFTMYALQYPIFVDLIGTAEYSINDGEYVVTNTNKLLGNYDGLIGGKTGYDDDAGYCLIEVATRNGSTMISVTLDGVAPDDWYDDNRVLLDYAFEQKADRDGKITGEVIGFADPDLSRISGMATPGGSAGEPEPTGTPWANILTPTASESATETPALPGLAPASDSGGMNDKLLIAVAVSALVVAAGVLGAIGGVRGPRRTD